MTWLREVTHVAWKDIKQQRWLVLAYLALIAVATWRAMLVARAVQTPSAMSGMMLIVVVFGCILSALFVQSDSPTRADGFWVSRPFRASAILGAKFLVVGAVVALVPLVGEAAGLSWFDVGAPGIPGMLLACFAAFGMWLLLSMLLGAMTRDLRSTIVAFIIVLIATALASGLLMTRAPRVLAQDWIQPVFVALTIVGAFATLATLYLQRGRALYAWVVACLTTGCAFVTAFSSQATPSVTNKALTAGPLQLAVQDPLAPGQTGRLRLTITGPNSPDSLSSRFIVSGVAIRLRDGSRFQLGRANAAVVDLRAVKLPIASGTQWLGAGSDDRPPSFDVELSGREMALMSRGVSEVEVTGLVTLERPRLIGALTLRRGAVLRTAGRRTRVLDVGQTTGGVTFDVISVGLENERLHMRTGPFISGDGFSFALVNDQRGEAIPLLNNGSGTSSDYLVLPGTSLTQSTFRLQSFVRPPGGDGWYRNARLVLGAYESAATYSAVVRANLD